MSFDCSGRFSSENILGSYYSSTRVQRSHRKVYLFLSKCKDEDSNHISAASVTWLEHDTVRGAQISLEPRVIFFFRLLVNVALHVLFRFLSVILIRTHRASRPI